MSQTIPENLWPKVHELMCKGNPLIFIRHGEAKDLDPSDEDWVASDLGRPLTRLGQFQAKKSAHALLSHNTSLKEHTTILSSPAKRALETAQTFRDTLPGSDVKIIEPLTTARWNGDWENVDSLFVHAGAENWKDLDYLLSKATPEQRRACMEISLDALGCIEATIEGNESGVLIVGHQYFLQSLARLVMNELFPSAMISSMSRLENALSQIKATSVCLSPARILYFDVVDQKHLRVSHI